MSQDVKCPKCYYSIALVPIKQHEDTRLKPQVNYAICQCPRTKCKYTFFVKYDALPDAETHVYPGVNTVPEFITDTITWTIREDIAEAHRCFQASAFRSVVVMCRRAFEQIVLEKEAEGNNLFEKSAHLFGRGLITESLNKAVHEIKYFQPYGANPNEDNLQYPTQDEAQHILTVILALADDLYVRPVQVSKDPKIDLSKDKIDIKKATVL